MQKFLNWIDSAGNHLVGLFHRTGLFAIGMATVYAAAWEFALMWNKHHASIQDLLLLFIYLEIGAMVGIYFKTNHMPVRFLIYIAITAITRHMVDLVANGKDHIWEIMVFGAVTFVLSISVLIIRYGSKNFSSTHDQET